MRKHLLLALAPLIAAAQLPTIDFSPHPEETGAGRVVWLKEHTTDLTDARPFQQAIGKARIVVLCSPSGNLQPEAALRITKLLHEELGFDIFATHTSLLQAEEFDRALDAGTRTGPLSQVIAQGARGNESRITNVPQDVIDYLRSTRQTPHPLHTTGLGTLITEEQFHQFATKLFALIDRIDPSLASASDRRVLKEFLQPDQQPMGLAVSAGPGSYNRARVQASESAEVMTRLTRSLHRLTPQATDGRELLMYRRILDDLTLRANFRARTARPQVTIPLPDWVARTWLPESKIIVWDGGPGINDRIYRPATMDEFHQLPAGSVYRLAIAGIKRRTDSRLELPEEFDWLVSQTGKPSFFLDFRSLPSTHWLRSQLTNRWPKTEFDRSLPEVFDGLVGIVR